MSEPVWIALYNGNAVELIDSVSVPALSADQSFARQGKKWSVKAAQNVTPGIENFIKTDETKDAKLKREDPYGFGITLLAMGIVFTCLAVLFIFFSLFGLLMRHTEAAKKVANQQEGLKTKGIDREVYMAVIGMALKQYEDDVHDVESGVITIRQKSSSWNDEFLQMTQFHQ